MLWRILTFVLLSLVASTCFGLEAFLWRQLPSSVPILMPLKSGQTPHQAIDEYFEKIVSDRHLKGLVESDEISDLRQGQGLHYQYGEITPFEFKTQKKPRFIIVTNELRELYGQPHNEVAANVADKLKASGADVIVLPVMHDVTLNAQEAKLYRQQIINTVDAMIILGGTDIDPYLYGEQVTHAIDVIRRRDVSELKFTRQFIEAEQGMSFGICRGHQMCAVSHGNRLVQDIQIEKDAPLLHRDGEHLIQIDRESAIFQDFANEPSATIPVNSYHHQEVVIPENDPRLKVTAISLDETPVVEAVEFRNGLGASLQFHPELMEDEVGKKLMQRFVRMTVKHKYMKSSCHEIMKALP